MLVISILGITKAFILPIVGLLLLAVPPFRTIGKRGMRSVSPGGWALLTFSILICISGIRDLRSLQEKNEVVVDMSPHVSFENNSSYIYLYKKDTLFYKFHFSNLGKGDEVTFSVNISAVGIFNNPKYYLPIPEKEVNLFGLLAGESKDINQSIALDGKNAPDSVYFQLKAIYPKKMIRTILRWYPGIDSIQTVSGENMDYLLPYLNN